MHATLDHLTSYPDVNALLKVLLEGVLAVLEHHFIGMYLDGSLASGDFDQDSDIDFVVVTDTGISDRLFWALRAMHDRIATIDAWFATQLEGFYVPASALRRYHPAPAMVPNLERGRGERLKWVHLGAAWVVHQHMLHDHGIAVAGPAPQTLVDPVAPNDLRRAMLSVLSGWVTGILRDPAQMTSRGYQSYIVLSLCRVLYTLEHGDVVSKAAAARWAQETLGACWTPLIEDAWEGRRHPGTEPPTDGVNETLEFIQFTLERGQHIEFPVTP